MALPRAHEEAAPAFVHTPEPALPLLEESGMRMRLVVGESHGARSPVKTLSAMFYADAQLQPDAKLALDFRYEERAAYVVEGTITYDGGRYDAGHLLVSSRKSRIAQAAEDWKAGRFDGVAGDREFIPLPDTAPGLADYP